MAQLDLNGYREAYEALCNPRLAQSMYDEGGVVMDDVLLTLHGPEHKSRRHLALRVFRRDFLRYYENEVFPATLEETLAPFLERGRADLVELGYRVTMNLTADFAGVDRPVRSVDETDTLLRLVMKFSEGATLVHSTRDKEEVRAEVRDALAEFDEVFLQGAIARREDLLAAFRAGRITEDDLPRDVLTVLLRNEDKVELPSEVLRREVAFYLQAGAHSTANSTVHALHEIFQWLEHHPQDAGRLAAEPLFVQRCVHESLRLHPASPVAWRRPVEPTRVADHEVKPGDHIVIDLHDANRDVSVFGEDAAVFNPHRTFSDSKLYPFGLTFGIGVHNCLGRDLDGGVIATRERIPDEHQMGIVTRLVRRLIDAGVRSDPDDAPEAATYTERVNWGRYPVRFG